MRELIKSYVRATGPININSIVGYVREQMTSLPDELELDSQIESHLMALIHETQIELWIDRKNPNSASVCFNIYTGEV